MNKFLFDKKHVPQELLKVLKILSEEYPFFEKNGNCNDGIKIELEKCNEDGISSVDIKGNKAIIKYNELSNACRGLGSLLAGINVTEKNPFNTLGIMIDCSRNAVMTIEYLKKWLRRLALMGYNTIMLYTEDTYKLPDEPYFGFLRGAYSMAEVKELDDYAEKLGIDVIACIQTLGHLGQVLKWPYYEKLRDGQTVLMVDEEETYKLIEKMILFWKNALRSKRIHIGMDETHDLGRGKFMDKNGYEHGFNIFNRHLSKVNDICLKHGLKPLIWSDMYFRLGNKNNWYYEKNTVIPDDVKSKIPKSVDLVYWDYCHTEKEFYLDWIDRHRDLGFEPVMASGVWTWSRLWYDHKQTRQTIKPCIEACIEAKLKEIFFTLWGDDGAYCEFDSSMAGLCFAAELSYGGDGGDEIMEKRFKAICQCSYGAQIMASEIQSSNDESFTECGNDISIHASAILWDDPLLGIIWMSGEPEYWDKVIGKYSFILEKLDTFRDSDNSGW